MSIRRARIQERGVDLGFAAAWRLVRILPASLVLALANRLADRGSRRGGAGIRQLQHNLRRVVGPLMPEPELDALVRRSARAYARYWVETFRLPSMSAAGVIDRVSVEGGHLIHEAVAREKGVVLALPHMGNWDTAGIWLIGQGIPFTTVAERLKPESLYRRFVAYRESLGMHVLPLTGGAPPAPLLAARLAEGGVVCLVGDRAYGDGGVEVELFGETAVLPAGPAMLAARTGATLLCVGLWNTADGWGIDVSGPIESADEAGLAARTRSMTQNLASAFQAQIAAHPADWHMLQPVWKADRIAAKAARELRAHTATPQSRAHRSTAPEA
jgi:lauroyl/myristoyl acyltransferase